MNTCFSKIILGIFIATLFPFSVSAAVKKPTCSLNLPQIDCEVRAYSVKNETSNITFSATDSKEKKVRITIFEEGGKKVLFKSKYVKVKKGKWKIKVTKKLAKDTYDILVSDEKGKLTIGTNLPPVQATSNTSFSVTPVPLLSGGLARAGVSVPVSYLQIKNTGKESATLKGFWVKQNGSAAVQSVIGFSTIDDKGGSQGFTGGIEGMTPFINGQAFAPTQAIVLAPGQMKLFTIKAMMSNNISSYIGSQLMIDVTGVDATAAIKGAFPIRGTTWTLSY